MSSLLQLLGLLNSTSVDISGLGKQVKPCSVPAGSDACWQLDSYTPNKKQRGDFFLCRCFGSENNTWIRADRCVKFWLWFRLAPSGRRRRLSWTSSPGRTPGSLGTHPPRAAPAPAGMPGISRGDLDPHKTWSAWHRWNSNMAPQCHQAPHEG